MRINQEGGKFFNPSFNIFTLLYCLNRYAPAGLGLKILHSAV